MIARLAARARRMGFEGPFYEGILGKARFLVESTVARSEIIFVATAESARLGDNSLDVELRIAREVTALAPYRGGFDVEYYAGHSDGWVAPFTWGEEAVVGLVDGRVAGMAWLQRGTREGFPTYYGRMLERDVRILRVGVVPSFRRRGVNTAMMRQLLERLFDEGAARVFIESHLYNLPSVKTFLRVGFRPIALIDVLELPGLRKFVRWRGLDDARRRLARHGVELMASQSTTR